MEQEAFLSGYCRVIDHSRTVCAVKEQGILLEADCCYGSCPHENCCTVAEKIREFLNAE